MTALAILFSDWGIRLARKDKLQASEEHWQGDTTLGCFNPLTPGAFCKKYFFGHFQLVIFKLDLGQCTFNPV